MGSLKNIISMSLAVIVVWNQVSPVPASFAAPLQTIIKNLEKKMKQQCGKKSESKEKSCKAMKNRISALKKKKKIEESGNTALPEIKGSTTSTTEENSVSQASSLQALKTKVIELTNLERSKLGLTPLDYNAALEAAAQAHTDDMQARNYVSHDSPEGTTSHDRIVKHGYLMKYQACECSKSFTLGENLAKGQETPEEVVKGWMSSEGHRENILKPEYTEIGIGMAMLTEKNGGGFSPNSYFWAQNFGTIRLGK